MPTPRPDDEISAALRRRGDHGVRAQRFLVRAAEHLDAVPSDSMAAYDVAYGIREALVSLLALGGPRPRGMRDAAKAVVDRFQAVGGHPGRLADSIRRLDEILGGPDPNTQRLVALLTQLAGLPPTRASADLVRRFIDAHDAAARLQHGAVAPSLDAVEALYSETIAVVSGLFGPMSQRLTAMDDLVGHPDPGAEEIAELKRRLGDERHLVYFFDAIEGPAWFRALRGDELLMPPPDRPWTAGPYVMRVAGEAPDEVRAWLAGFGAHGLNERQAAELLRIARMAGGDVAEIALGLSRTHLADPNVRFQVDTLLRELPDEQFDTRASRSLLKWLLEVTLAERRGSFDMYMAAEHLARAVKAAAGPDAGAWLTMLAHRVREVAKDENPLRLRVLPPLGELTLTRARRGVELAAAAVRQAATATADAGLSLDQRLDALRLAPEPLAARLVAQHLLDRFNEAAPQARCFLSDQAATNEWPSPEELALLRRLFEDGGPAMGAEIAVALGTPPAKDAIDAIGETGDVPEPLVRARRWLVAIPPDAAPEWHAADERLGDRMARAPRDGVLIRTPQARFFAPQSPIATADLSALTPIEAAQRVAAWRPEADASFFGPSAEGLADALQAAINAAPDAWRAADPVAIVEALRQPAYVVAYLEALRALESPPLEPERVVAATELIRSEPWPADDLGPDLIGSQNLWSRAGDAAIRLVGALGPLRALPDVVAERAWTQITEAFRDRGEPSALLEPDSSDALTVAINRPSMRALEIAFAVGATDDGVDPRLLALVDEALGLDGVDGLHARAMLARPLAWLRQQKPDWFTQNASRIFGPDAPDGLGVPTVDLYLEWGTPTRELLTDLRDAIVTALSRDRYEDAVQHLLLGLLWQVLGFEPPAVAADLITGGDRAVSHAGYWLGAALADVQDDLNLGPALELWGVLLERRLPAAAYAGFGWTAVNPHFDDDDWLTLIEQTAAGAALDESHVVAERVSRAAGDPRAARIVAALLAGNPQPWEIQRIGEVGLELLPSVSGDAAAELRERLLERGFFEARGS